MRPFLGVVARPILLSLTLCLWILASGPVQAQQLSEPFSRDLQVDVRINQVGYVLEASKQLVVPGRQPQTFEVRSLPADEVVYQGQAQPAGGDFGRYLTGDFSAVTTPGTYYITVQEDSSRSYPFRIGADVYNEGMQMIESYFSKQRCGASKSGYLSPCHLDEGVRLDNGEHQDVTGGWHDASDLRKWVEATLYGMIGLSKLKDVLNPRWAQGQLLQELRWGNKYFLKMQEPEGYVMRQVGGSIKTTSGQNRWTNNEIGPDGGEIRVVSPTTGSSGTPAALIGSKDDRIIETSPAPTVTQFNFIASEARMSRFTRTKDPSYAEKCLQAARRALQWALQEKIANGAGDYGALVQAAVAMHRTTGEARYRKLAAEYVGQLLSLQVTEPIGNSNSSVRGFFRTSASNPEPYREVFLGPLPLLGLTAALEAFPEHKDAETWREALTLHTQGYLSKIAQRNSFQIVPLGLFTEAPGGDRRVGSYWYRYFMQPDGWWVGINANLASTGVGLTRAARILEEPELAGLAQRQLDWILGANSFGASTMEGAGYNHPERFVNGSEFRPPTPRLEGAVMNGLGGNEEDEPVLGDGSYHTSEYWTPMTGYTLWLMAELQRGM